MMKDEEENKTFRSFVNGNGSSNRIGSCVCVCRRIGIRCKENYYYNGEMRFLNLEFVLHYFLLSFVILILCINFV